MDLFRSTELLKINNDLIEKGHKKESGANRCACFLAFCIVALAAIHVKPLNKNKTKILDFMVIL
jgi:hypothetical protein